MAEVSFLYPDLFLIGDEKPCKAAGLSCYSSWTGFQQGAVFVRKRETLMLVLDTKQEKLS